MTRLADSRNDSRLNWEWIWSERDSQARIADGWKQLVGLGRVELPTSPLSVESETIPTCEDGPVTCYEDLQRVLEDQHKQRVLWAWFHRMEVPAVMGNCYQMR